MEKENPFAFEKYEGAQVAAQYIQKKDFGRAGLALLTVPLDDDARTLLNEDPQYTKPEGIKKASDIFGGKFYNGLRESTLSQLLQFYAKPLLEISEGARAEAVELFRKNGDQKLGKIQIAYLDAQEIIGDQESLERYKRTLASTGLSGDELEAAFKKGVKKAEDTVNKYERIIHVQNLLQETRNQGIEKKVRGKSLEGLLKAA